MCYGRAPCVSTLSGRLPQNRIAALSDLLGCSVADVTYRHSCPLAGLRAPELAAGELHRVFEDAMSITAAEVDPQRSRTPSIWSRAQAQEAAHVQSHCVSYECGLSD